QLLAPELAREELLGAREPGGDLLGGDGPHRHVREAVDVRVIQRVDQHPVVAREVAHAAAERVRMRLRPVLRRRSREVHRLDLPRPRPGSLEVKLAGNLLSRHRNPRSPWPLLTRERRRATSYAGRGQGAGPPNRRRTERRRVVPLDPAAPPARATARVRSPPGGYDVRMAQQPNVADLRISSPAFDGHRRIPERHTADGDDVSPPLRWSGAPEGTRAFAVVVHDPDAPLVDGFTHWVAYGISASAEGLDEGEQAPRS